jgi:hypothetical protein
MEVKWIVFGLCVTIPSWGAINVPLTIQEAIPIGALGCTTAAACGISRSNEPFRVGIPLPDDPSSGTMDTSTLALSGCRAGQFRILGRWPSGRVKWLEVSGIVPSFTGGGTATCTVTDSGSGNFGGSNLATDNGATITVDTGAAVYIVKKANFNVFDQVTVGGTAIVASSLSATRGIVLTGPAFNATTCAGGCSTVYSSANDPNSTVSIEENGPVEAVLKAMGGLIDGSGNVYTHYTLRMHFWKGKAAVKLHFEHRNAEDNTSSFNTAFKAFAALEFKIDLAASGPFTFTFGGKSGPVTGSFSGSEDATLVQLYSDVMQDLGYDGIGEWNNSSIPQNSTQSIIPRSSGTGCSDYYCYPDATRSAEGYTIKDGATVLETGDRKAYVTGYADTKNASGGGALIGVGYLTAYWPKSLELNNGGGSVTIGVWPKEVSGFNWWICYTCYQVSEFFFVPHSAALSSPANTFLALQYDLIARAPLSQYNTSNAFPWGIVPDPGTEDNYYTSMTQIPSTRMCCLTDTIAGNPPYVIRYWAFGATGGANESDTSDSYLMNFITRGYTAKYVFARLRERWIEESVFPRSDFPGGWRSKQYGPILDALGFPRGISSANASQAIQMWQVNEGGFEQHSHFYSMPHWYYVTGEEHYADSIKQGYYDFTLNPNVPLNGLMSDLGYPSVPRATGPHLLFITRVHDFAAAIGDSTSASTAYNVAEALMNKAVRPVLVTPKANCSAALCRGSGDYGTDRVRGANNAMAMQQNWFLPADQTIGTGDGVTTTFNFTLNAPRYPLDGFSGGGSAQFPNIMITAGSITAHDNTIGTGVLSGTGVTGGTINYYTGDGSVTFNVPPANGVPINAHFFYPTAANQGPSGVPGYARIAGFFQSSLLVQGIMEYAYSRGPSWSGYEDTMDLAYGIAENFLHRELTVEGQPGGYANNGSHFGIVLDFCNDPRPTSICHSDAAHTVWWANDPNSASMFAAEQTIWWQYRLRAEYFNDNTWVSNWQTELYRTLNALAPPNTVTEYGRPDIAHLVYLALNQPTPLSEIRITNFVDNGGGDYTVSWVVPNGLVTPSGAASPYKFKWASKQIVHYIPFDDAETNSFLVSPSANVPWFAANNVSDEPAPLAPGSTQTYTFHTGIPGLNAGNFSLKGYYSAGCSIAPGAVGPFYVGQPVSTIFTSFWCSSGTWSASGLAGSGLTLDSVTNLLRLRRGAHKRTHSTREFLD